MRNLSILFLLLIFTNVQTYSQVTIHVPGDYSTIQAGIDAAQNGDMVLVDEGTYYENINFKGKAITVASHFILDENESHIENTIIDGSQSTSSDTASVVVFLNGEDTTSVLCGFTITGGTGTYDSEFPAWNREGGGIYTSGSGAKIINNIITGNTAMQTTTGNYSVAGGGICASPSPSGKNLIIKDNIITDNYAEGEYYSYGAGIGLWPDGKSIISNNIITNNTAISPYVLGGGMYISIGAGVQPLIINNYISENTANSQGSTTIGGGGGVYVDYSTAIIKNNLIVLNEGTEGGGIKFYGASNSILENNTVLNNTSNGFGGGVRNQNASVEIKNTIVWGNDGSGAEDQISGSMITVTYSDVEGGYTGTGNIDEYPNFNDSTYFCLNQNSLCIDAGNPDPMYNDVEDPNNPGYALYPAMGTLINDMGAFGGPNSTWASVLSDTLYVPEDYSTIQEAIDAAINGNVVLVAEDTYYENINFKGKAITVASYFSRDGDSTHIENTIIDGSQPSNPDSGSVVYFISGEDTTSVLCGFTITGGTGTLSVLYGDVSGGGVYVGSEFLPSSAKICNNILEFNSVSSDSFANGGGIVADIEGASIIIENNLIINNTVTGNAWSTGAGLAIYDFTYTGYAKIVNNKIIDNTLTDGVIATGGGIEITGGADQFFIIGNYIKGNECNAADNWGGGLDLYDCSPIVKNNLIVENSAKLGGGVALESVTSTSSKSERNKIRRLSNRNNRLNDNQFNSSKILLASSFENNTIVNNSATEEGGGIYNWVPTTPQLMNFIIWGNTAPSGSQISGTADVQYSDVEGGFVGNGNIDLDPQFDLTHPYFTFMGTSPCIDGGNPDAQYNDVEDPNNLGNPLPPAQGTLRNDMGHVGGPSSLWPYWDWPMPVESSSQSVSEFALMHNYPNPFNPSTTIKYEIKELTGVELKVFDILGREIITLVNEEKPAGSYEIVFDAIGLPSGIYFYRLQAGSFVETKKMLLLK